jgi:anti-anti-sigma regulatory factor
VLRITQVDAEAGKGATTGMRVEGTLNGETVAALMDACRPLLRSPLSGSGIVLDIAGVRFVDAAATDALRDLMSQGVRVIGSSPLVRGFLQMEACDEA